MPRGIQEGSDDFGRSLYNGGPYTWQTSFVVHSQHGAIFGSIISSGSRRGGIGDEEQSCEISLDPSSIVRGNRAMGHLNVMP